MELLTSEQFCEEKCAGISVHHRSGIVWSVCSVQCHILFYQKEKNKKKLLDGTHYICTGVNRYKHTSILSVYSATKRFKFLRVS